MRLHAHELALTYGRDPVIADLTVHIPNGQVTALVGANASGKSTLLRGLARLLQPAVGTVYLDGRALTRMNTKDIARHMAVLPQGPDPTEGVTVRQLVAHGRYPHQGLFRQWSHRDEQAVAHALAATGTTDLADRAVNELSGGQRQRAWIAMTLAQEATVMLLDEPTTFLDITHQVDVLDLLHDLNERDGRTIVMALHDLNQAARYAHHILAIRDGRLAAEGSPRHLITEPVVRDIFGLDVHIIQDPTTGAPLCIPISSRIATPHHRPV